MGRPLKPGAKQLKADQRRDFAELRSKLGLTGNELVTLVGMNQSEFSNAVRENGKRSFKADQWTTLSKYVDGHLQTWARDPKRTEEELGAARSLYRRVFDEEEVSAPADVQPGDQMPANTATYVQRPIQDDMEEAIGGGLPLIWILGGPKTGKTSMIARAVEFCARTSVKCYRVDLEAVVGRTLQTTTPSPGKAAADQLADIWNEIMLALESDALWEPDAYSTQVLPSKFGHDLSSVLAKRAKGGRKLLIIDHLDRLRIDHERESLIEALIYSLALIRTEGWTIILADEGIRTSSPLLSRLVTRGTMITLGGFSQIDVRRLFERMGLSMGSISEGVFSEYVAAVGNNPFLHHAAAVHLKRTKQSTGRYPRRDQKLVLDRENILATKEWILAAFLKPDRHSTIDSLEQEIIRFRESIVKALCTLAGIGGIDHKILFAKLCSPNSGIGGSLGLPSRVDIGLHWSNLLPTGAEVPESLQRIAKFALSDKPAAQRIRKAAQ